MAALDFPDAPTNGTVYDRWTWNGSAWALTIPSATGFTFSQDATPTALRAGDTWYKTDSGESFVWTSDGTSSQWVQFAPGAGAIPGFTYVADTTPTPSKIGDTWFDTSTSASGGTSWIALEEAPGGEKVWIQTSGLAPPPEKGYWAAAQGVASQAVLASGISTVSWVEPVLGNIVYEGPGIGTLAFVIPKTATYLMSFRFAANISTVDRARINWMTQYATDTASTAGVGSTTQMIRATVGSKFQFQTYNQGAAGIFTYAYVEIRELGSSTEGLRI